MYTAEPNWLVCSYLGWGLDSIDNADININAGSPIMEK